MKTNAIVIGAFALAIAAGCHHDSTTTSASNAATPPPAATASATTMTPEQLGEIGAEIKRHPDDARKILADHGLDESTFEKAIRNVSSDPAASRRYAAAYRKRV